MERLTTARGERTWKLYHLSWYLNILIVMALLFLALYFYVEAVAGADTAAHDVRNGMILAVLLVVASVLLMGAGMSRHQARLEGQHLELKLAIKEISDRIDSLKKQS